MELLQFKHGLIWFDTCSTFSDFVDSKTTQRGSKSEPKKSAKNDARYENLHAPTKHSQTCR